MRNRFSIWTALAVSGVLGCSASESDMGDGSSGSAAEHAADASFAPQSASAAGSGAVAAARTMGSSVVIPTLPPTGEKFDELLGLAPFQAPLRVGAT